MSADPVEIRSEVFRFLYERRALPHQRSAVQAGLNRAGTAATEDEIQEALDYLVSAEFVDRHAGPMGGGNRHATWKINHLGINAYEEQNG
jgi:hypothetical protein